MGATNQITSHFLTALALLFLFGGMGVAAYGLFTEKGLSNMFVIGIVLMVIAAIIFIAGQRRH